MSTIKVDTIQTRGGVSQISISTLKADTIQNTSGTSEIAIDKLKGASSAGSMTVVGEGGTTTTNLQQGLAKAWVRYATTTTTVINDSFNVSAINDGGTGSTTISFSNNMGNSNFSVGAIAGQDERFVMFRSPSTTSWLQQTTNTSAIGADVDRIGGNVFGDLA